jgi:hypothetical protein
MLTAIINVLMPHVVPFAQILFEKMKRRHCSHHRASQEQLNDLYAPKQPELADRSASLLANFSLAVFYSAAIPLLIPLSAAAFAIAFWFEKAAFLRLYRLPPRYGPQVALLFAALAPLAILGHCFVAAWAFTSPWSHSYQVFSFGRPSSGVESHACEGCLGDVRRVGDFNGLVPAIVGFITFVYLVLARFATTWLFDLPDAFQRRFTSLSTCLSRCFSCSAMRCVCLKSFNWEHENDRRTKKRARAEHQAELEAAIDEVGEAEGAAAAANANLAAAEAAATEAAEAAAAADTTESPSGSPASQLAAMATGVDGDNAAMMGMGTEWSALFAARNKPAKRPMTTPAVLSRQQGNGDGEDKPILEAGFSLPDTELEIDAGAGALLLSKGASEERKYDSDGFLELNSAEGAAAAFANGGTGGGGGDGADAATRLRMRLARAKVTAAATRLVAAKKSLAVLKAVAKNMAQSTSTMTDLLAKRSDVLRMQTYHAQGQRRYRNAFST